MYRRADVRHYGRFVPLVLLLLVWAGATVSMCAQTAPSTGSINIHLERKKGDVVAPVAQNTVFRTGDILRFRLTSRIAGYLYVVDKGTTGETDTLFPGASAIAGDNRIEMNQSYLVPADGDGWFEVSGPAGFDILYFLVSATPISLPPAAAAQGQGAGTPATTSAPPPGMLPRCDDAIFQARGECLDKSAGVKPLTPGDALPRELVPLARTASRDIILTDDGDDTSVQPAATAKLPLIYTFRLAHRN